MDPTDHIPLNPRDYLVLLALTDGPRHGYGLVKDIEVQSGGVVRIDPANLYRSVKRMIGDGLVGDADTPASEDDSAERRRYYGITELGEAVVRLEAERLAELTALARARSLLPEAEAAR